MRGEATVLQATESGKGGWCVLIKYGACDRGKRERNGRRWGEMRGYIKCGSAGGAYWACGAACRSGV